MRGILVFDKPQGVTSSQMLGPIRRILRKKAKVGHAGTLDPFATGVMIGLIGDTTRLSDLAMGLPKTYETTVRFGTETATLDPEGEVVAQEDPGSTAPADLDAAVAEFVGEIDQTPPVYSAIKVSGKPAYRWTREGSPPELTSRRVTIYSIEILGVEWPDVRLRVRCGAGMYVRSLARDLGVRVGLPASLVALRRTAVGPFEAETALRFDPTEPLAPERLEESLRDPACLVEAADLAALTLPCGDARLFASGNPVALPLATATRLLDAPVAVFTETESDTSMLVGLGRVEPPASLRASTVLATARVHLDSTACSPESP